MKMGAPPGLPPTPGEELVSFLYNRILFVWFPTHLETTVLTSNFHIFIGVWTKNSVLWIHMILIRIRGSGYGKIRIWNLIQVMNISVIFDDFFYRRRILKLFYLFFWSFLCLTLMNLIKLSFDNLSFLNSSDLGFEKKRFFSSF